jgi:hypothetical protein
MILINPIVKYTYDLFLHFNFLSAIIIFLLTLSPMRKSRLLSNLVAIVLLVALSQKIGFGIFYHNWQHSKACDTTLPLSSSSVNGANCNCIDDFSVPFTGSSIYVFTAPTIYPCLFLSSSIEFSSNFYRCFHALRAPPAFAA